MRADNRAVEPSLDGQVLLFPWLSTRATVRAARSGDYDIYLNQFDCDWPPPDAPGCHWNPTDFPVSDDPTGAAQYWARIVVAAGEPVAFWLDDRGGATHVRTKQVNQGGASEVISDASAVPVSLAASATADGHMFVVWQDARGTSYDIWGTEYDPATGSWSTPIRIDDDPASSAQLRPTVAVSATEVAAAWRDSRTGNPDIRARRRAPQGQGIDHFTFSYDGLNRLTAVSGPVAETFTFDAATNIASRTGPSAAYTHDEANRVTSDGAQVFTWDGADRLIQRGSDTFAYDPLARLTSSTVAGTTRTYAYDGDGLLLSRTDALTSSFLWDASVAPAPLLEINSDRVVHGLGPLYLVKGDGSTLTLARDGLGSVRAEVNDLGVVTKAFRYAVYGAISDRAPLDATPTLLGYTGELTDPSGLTYLRARWYDAVTGSLMTRDPVPGHAATPRSLNAYLYSYANPLTFTDPSGRCPVCWGAAFGLIGYAVYVAASGQPFDPAQATIATAAGAATGGLSAFVGTVGFTSAAAIAMRAASGAAVGGIAQIASLDVRMLRGEQLTRAGAAEIPAGMIVGAATGAVPLRDPDLGRGAQSFITGVGLGGANAIVGEALQDLLARLIADSGGAPDRAMAPK